MSVYKCSKCSYSSKTKGLVKQHIDRVNKCSGAELIEDIVKVKCEVCNKEFDTEKIMLSHRKKCVEKKAIVVNNFTEPEKVENMIIGLTNLINECMKQNTELRNDNTELIKRIEKLECKKECELGEKIDKREEMPCLFRKEIQFVPHDFTQVNNMLKKYGLEDEINVELTINGERSNKLEGNIEDEKFIDVDGIKYYYNKNLAKKEKLKFAGDLKIILFKCCEEYALHRTEHGEFCDEHVH